LTFLAPDRLLFLVPVYGLALAYLFMQLRRRRRYEVRFTNLALLGVVAPRRPGWRRHVPAALMLLAVGCTAVAYARPARDELVPRERATVMLALDVSISMAASDVPPTRLDSARAAAASFTADLPADINLGLVTFAGTAQVVVAPTTDRASVHRALDTLRLREATAIGDAVLAALAALDTVPRGRDDAALPAHVVLMSDGEITAGVPVEIAAGAAKEAEVPVSTISFGTATGVIEYEGQLFDVPVNGASLRTLAEATGGRFFEAATSAQLRAVYGDIGSAVGFEAEHREVTAWFVGVALVLGLLAATASLVWFSRIP
jgi:Ca-activated chloride channel family protein